MHWTAVAQIEAGPGGRGVRRTKQNIRRHSLPSPTDYRTKGASMFKCVRELLGVRGAGRGGGGGRCVGRSAARVPGGGGGIPTCTPQNDCHDTLIIFNYTTRVQNFFKKIAHQLRLPSAKV